MSSTEAVRLTLRGILVVAVVVSAGTAAAVTVLVQHPNPVVPVSGTLSASQDFTVDEQRLNYTGTDVTALDVVVNNTGTATHNATLHVAIEDGDGTVVERATLADRSFDPGTRTVTITFDAAIDVSNVSRVELTVEQTS